MFGTKDDNGYTPMHLLGEVYHYMIPKILKLSVNLISTLTIQGQRDDNVLHVLARYSSPALPTVVNLLETGCRKSILRSQDIAGNTSIHIVVRKTPYATTLRLVLGSLARADDRFEVLKVRTKLGATALHVALANCNHKAFETMVESMGEANSLKCFNVKVSYAEFCGTCLKENIETTAEAIGNLNVDATSLYYILCVAGRHATDTLRGLIVQRMDQDIQEWMAKINQLQGTDLQPGESSLVKQLLSH